MKSSDPEARVRQLLQDRAVRLARQLDDARERPLLAQVAVLAVGRERFGIPAKELRGIVEVPHVTPLRGLPPWMTGVAQVRGEIMSVVDLAAWLEVADAGPAQCLAVTDVGPGPLGLLATSVLGFRDVFVDEVASEFVNAGGAAHRPVGAVTRDLLAILELPALVSSSRLRVVTE